MRRELQGELIAGETKEVITEVILEYCPHTSYGFLQPGLCALHPTYVYKIHIFCAFETTK
jgi:hypothetical protein